METDRKMEMKGVREREMSIYYKTADERETKEGGGGGCRVVGGKERREKVSKINRKKGREMERDREGEKDRIIWPSK